MSDRSFLEAERMRQTTGAKHPPAKPAIALSGEGPTHELEAQLGQCYVDGVLPNIHWTDKLVLALRAQFGWTELDWAVRQLLTQHSYDLWWTEEGRRLHPPTRGMVHPAFQKIPPTEEPYVPLFPQAKPGAAYREMQDSQARIRQERDR